MRRLLALPSRRCCSSSCTQVSKRCALALPFALWANEAEELGELCRLSCELARSEEPSSALCMLVACSAGKCSVGAFCQSSRFVENFVKFDGGQLSCRRESFRTVLERSVAIRTVFDLAVLLRQGLLGGPGRSPHAEGYLCRVLGLRLPGGLPVWAALAIGTCCPSAAAGRRRRAAWSRVLGAALRCRLPIPAIPGGARLVCHRGDGGRGFGHIGRRNACLVVVENPAVWILLPNLHRARRRSSAEVRDELLYSMVFELQFKSVVSWELPTLAARASSCSRTPGSFATLPLVVGPHRGSRRRCGGSSLTSCSWGFTRCY